MSDSDLSDAPMSKAPSDGALEKALRKETAVQFEDTSKSINSIRKGAEESLGLRTGFFVNHERWKARSKEIIKTALDVLEKVAEPSSPPVSAKTSPAKPKIIQPATKAVRKKRPPPPPTEKPPQKRQKKSLPPREDSGDELSTLPADESDTDAEIKAKKPKANATAEGTLPATTLKQSQANGKPKPKPTSQDSDSELSDDTAKDSDSVQAAGNFDDDSRSEMSVLIDEDPQPKKKRKRKDSSEKPKTAVKAKPTAEDDPDQEEIKRLQGWLVKCGIRKIWAFELKPYDTSKAKIKHLKDMLADIGMTGRYSLEKASQIKEARELAADIEAVQEGNEIWGKDGEERSRRSKRSDRAAIEDDLDDEDNAPKKKLVRGPKRYDFLSSDGEESDWDR